MGVDPAYYEGLPGMVMGSGMDLNPDHFMLGEEHHDRASIFGEPHGVVAHHQMHNAPSNQQQTLVSAQQLEALAMNRSQSVMLPPH